MTVVLKIEELIDYFEQWYLVVEEKVDDTLDQVYEKIPGKYFGLISFMIYAFSTFAAVFLYLSADPSYSIFTHWISHLGDGPNGANNVFNIGWFISSFVLFFFYVHEIRTLRNKKVTEKYLDLLTLTSFSFAIGILLISIFPLQFDVLHAIPAIVYFVGRFGFTIIYGFIALHFSEGSKTLAVAAYSTATCYFLYFLSPIITKYTSQIGITMYFLEWLTLIAEFLMMVIIIIQQFLIDDIDHKPGTRKVKIR